MARSFVDGPSIMDGYLGRGRAQKPLRTGDLGDIDSDGFLTIHGRKDNLLVTAFGRNISPRMDRDDAAQR